MHEAETRALKRAAILLVVLSVARWAWTAAGPAPGAATESVLPELLSASREAAEVETRRSTPLAAGERIDPNTADEVALDRLPGVGPSTARAILEAREDGAVFRRPEDLAVVRGIGEATVERLRASLDLDSAPPPRRAGTPARESDPGAAAGPVDVNHADLGELQRLPGIGPAMAERILVARREQLFTKVEDLVRVRGIGPATVERLRPYVTLGGGP